MNTSSLNGKLILPICALLISSILFPIKEIKAQDNVVFFCNYKDDGTGEETCEYLQVSSFMSNDDAERVVAQICGNNGIPHNFQLVSCPGIDNARALTPENKLRYILYDPDFISSVDAGNTNWVGMSILAHEIGHHLANHTLDIGRTQKEKREHELQADHYAGFQLQLMGASLEEAQAAVMLYAFEGDDKLSAHPNKKKRLAQIKEGYLEAENLGRAKAEAHPPDYLVFAPGTETFVFEGNEHFTAERYNEAIESYTKAIQKNSQNIPAYFFRGQVKKILQDYDGAIADFTLAIALENNLYGAYDYRGRVYYNKGNYSACIDDMTKALSGLQNPEAITYFDRGRAKEKIGDYPGAYADITRAIQMDGQAIHYLSRGHVQEEMKNYSSAINDYNAAINLEPDFIEAYFNRAVCFFNIGDYKDASSDYKIAIENGYDDTDTKLLLGQCYEKLNEHKLAIDVFTDIIKEEPDNGIAYYFRGLCYKKLEEHDNAVADFSAAISNGYATTEVYYEKGLVNYYLKQYDLAINDLTNSVNTKPTSSHAHYTRYAFHLRGIINRKLDKMDDACADFTQACDLGHEESCMAKAEACK